MRPGKLGRNVLRPYMEHATQVLSLDFDEQDPGAKDPRRKGKQNPWYDPVEAIGMAGYQKPTSNNKRQRRELVREYSQRAPGLRMRALPCAGEGNALHLPHDEARRAYFNSEREIGLPRDESERRDDEHGYEREQCFRRACRQMPEFEDAREVDRDGHEEQARERRGCAGFCYEEVVPALHDVGGGHGVFGFAEGASGRSSVNTCDSSFCTARRKAL